MWSDLRYALRGLGRNSALAVVAILTLALGIGVNTTMFSVADAYFLRPLPGNNPSRLVRLTSHTPQGEDDYFSYPDYREISRQCNAFSGILAYSGGGGFLNGSGGSRLILVDLVSRNYFSVLGIGAFRGRTFSSVSAASSQPTIVLSYAEWQNALGGDPALIGKTVTLTGKSYTLIGITPPSFPGLTRDAPRGAWLPVDTKFTPGQLQSRGFRDFQLVGRLRESSSAAQAQAQLTAIATRLANVYPATNAARSFGLVSESQRLREGLAPTGLLLALTGLVLLIACANVAGLLVAQSETRRREIAVRLAIGASRWRLVRQMLTESALLGLAGAVAAVLLASWLIRLQSAFMPPEPFPVGANLQINASVAIFTLAVALIAIFIFGLTPALPASKTDVVTALKSDGGRIGARSGRHRMRSVFVVGEVALAVVLMSGAGLLLKSLIRATHESLGFDAHKKLLVEDLSPGVNGQHGEQSWRYFERVQSKVGELPGVKKVTFALRTLLSQFQSGVAASVSIPGVEFPQGQPTIDIEYNSVAPNYFQTVGTAIVAGRAFQESDGPNAPKVAIVDETMAHRFWPRGDAIGKVIEVDRVPSQIVGIAEDAKVNSIHEAPKLYMYFPFPQRPVSEANLIVETGQAPEAIEKTIQDTIRSVNPNVPMIVTTTGQLMKIALWGDRTTAELVGGLGLLGIFLAAIGLYGVVAYLVNGRTQEIGLRLALGAQHSEVLRLVVGQGLKLAALGACVGVLLALGATRFMASLLHGVNPDDPLTLGISCILAVAVALAASYIPARRAMRVDPANALRAE